MTTKEMNHLMEKIQIMIKSTRESGQKEYAHNTDNVFANFERVADSLDISRQQALAVYLLKHVDGVMSYIQGHKSQREDVRGRITDIIVYLMLLWGMVEEDEHV